MAELNDFIKSLEKELTCSICEDIFSEPKQLRCIHNFCGKCIEKWNETCKNTRQRLTCPTCRSREDGDVSKLPSSFYLDSMKQLLFAMRNKASKPEDKLELPNCVSCQEQVKLVAFCQQCQGMICTDCVNAHKKIKQLRDEHQMIMFIDFKQEHVNSYISNQFHCDQKYHENQKLEYFCETCQKCICQTCSITTHSNHEKISLRQKADEKKLLIEKSLHQMSQVEQKFVQELELSKQNIERVENEIKTAKNEVSHHVQELVRILKDHENKMKKSLDDMFIQEKRANDEEQEEITAVIQQFHAVKEHGKSLQVQNVDHLILQSQLPQKCDDLLQTRSVLSSKPNRRNVSFSYSRNAQVTQSLQDLGKIVEIVPGLSRCSLEVQNKEIRCGFVNQCEIVTRDSQGNICYTNRGSIDVQIKDDEGCDVEKEIVENEKGKFFVTYKAEKPLSYQILVSVAGKTMNDSPLKVTTFDANREFKPVTIFEEQRNLGLPISLAVSDSRQVAAIVDGVGHSVIVISTKDGKCLRRIGGLGTGDGELYEPRGVVVYEDRIVVSDSLYGECGRIQEFDINGTYLRTIYKQEGVVLLFGMCTTGDNISVLSYCELTDGKKQVVINVFDKYSGHLIKDILICTVEANKAEEELPYCFAYDNNKYFLSHTLKKNISVHSDNGVFLYKFGEEGKSDGQFGGAFGLTTFGGDRLLVCDAYKHRIQVFTPEGEFITTFGSYGSGLGQMNCPCDVAVTPDGKVFVLEADENRVQVWQ